MIEVRLGDLFLIIDMRRKRMYVFRTDFSKCPLLLEKYSREKKNWTKIHAKVASLLGGMCYFRKHPVFTSH